MITISNKFDHGEFVYMIHDSEYKCMIVAIEIYMDKSYLYKVTGHGINQYCQERELIKEDERVYCPTD